MLEEMNKETQESRREELVKNLLNKELGIEARAITVLTGGQVGHVYRVETADKPYVVKFVDVYPEPTFADEPRDDRVYGSRWSNLAPVYSLLKEKDIAVAELHASGTREKENLHYEILDYLEGTPEDYSPEWFATVGKALGEMHSVRRPFQGWVAMEHPYTESWIEAFTKSLESRLEETKPFLTTELYDSVSQFLSNFPKLTEPQDFVLSHTDGFQGVFKKENGEWKSLGVVDIEDHEFTDQRFALTGLELQHSFGGRSVPSEFWDAYKRATRIDDSLETYKSLFKVYYLLVWTRVLRNQPESYAACVAKLEEIVGKEVAK